MGKEWGVAVGGRKAKGGQGLRDLRVSRESVGGCNIQFCVVRLSVVEVSRKRGKRGPGIVPTVPMVELEVGDG